ncbi:uncharacterized protein [Panulirus ornatus]|uniref:uncharacterized protein n=1 Tax=Panulirus ornatus TaxID=150431 RepID=UPI003A885965
MRHPGGHWVHEEYRARLHVLPLDEAGYLYDDGEQYLCEGTGVVRAQLPSVVASPVQLVVVAIRPMNLNFVLYMNGVNVFHGVTVRTPNDVWFGVHESPSSAVATVATGPVIDEKDFTVTHDAVPRKWTVLWKLCDGMEPPRLLNTISENRIRPGGRQVYEREVS